MKNTVTKTKRKPQTLIVFNPLLTLRSRSAVVPTNSTSDAGAKLAMRPRIGWRRKRSWQRERTKPLAGEAVRKNRKPPVTSTGKTKAKQVKKSRSSAQSKTEEESEKWPLRLSMSPSKNG